MGTQMAGAPALDAYLHQSFDLIQYVADNMSAIKAVADHLTPVEDLVDFKATIDELYGKLDLLVEASELIIQTTPAGIRLLLAPDAAAQRLVLGLGSAAVQTVDYFAKTTDFNMLSAYVEEINEIVTQLNQDMAARVTHGELDAVVAGIQLQLVALGQGTVITDRINQILIDLANGAYTTSLNGRVGDLEARVTFNEGNLTGQASIVGQMTLKLDRTKDGLDSLASSVVTLRTNVSNLATGLSATSIATESLTTRATLIEGRLTTQAQSVTALQSQADNLVTQMSAQASATSTLATQVSNTATGQETMSYDIIQLSGRVLDAETGLQGTSDAVSELSTKVLSNEQGLTVAAADIVRLNATITGGGNLLPNAGFTVDTDGWLLFSRGAGWLAAELSHNLEPERLPFTMGALSLTAPSVPSGSAGISSPMIPITGQSRYMLSGYLAAENCTLRMEWRLFDANGAQIDLGIVGLVTNKSPATTLPGWYRASHAVPTPPDAVSLQLQLWVTACNTAAPKVWLLRPLVEEASGGQIGPSPWTEGSSDLPAKTAAALQALTVLVEDKLDGALATSESVTQLLANIGGMTLWEATTIAGSLSALEAGSPYPPSLRRPGGDPVVSFLSGLTLVQFKPDGSVLTSTRYQTFASNTERSNLAAALNAFTRQDTFLLISAGNHGIKTPELTAAMERCGALVYSSVTGSRPYSLRGAGGIGKGAGIEVYANTEAPYIDFTFTVVNGAVAGLSEQTALAGQAEAITSLTARVEVNEAGLTSASSQVTNLTSELLGTQLGLSAERAAREGDSTRVAARLRDITSDSILTPNEKSDLIREVLAITREEPGIVAEADGSTAIPGTPSLNAKRDTYTTSIDTLMEYLDTLNTPYRWDDSSGDTYLI